MNEKKQYKSPLLKRSPLLALDYDLIGEQAAGSPLKALDYNLIGQQAAGGQGGAGSMLSNAIQTTEDDIIKQQKEEAEALRRDQQDQMRKMQYADMIAKQQEGLIVPGDTGINQADVAVNQASRALVDQASQLTAQLSNNEITSDEWATKTAIIRSQVPALKTFKDTLNKNIGSYQEAIANGDLSSANGLEVDDLYGSLLNGTGDINLGIDPESGMVTFAGTTAGGEAINIPASGINQMPKPILKAPDPYEVMQDPFKQLAQAQSELTPEQLTQKTEEILGGMLPEDPDAQNKMLLSLAVDRFGMPLEDAKKMLMSQGDDGENPLSEFVKEKFEAVGTTAFEAQVINRRKQEQALQNAQLEEIRKQQMISHAQQINPLTVQGQEQGLELQKSQIAAQNLASYNAAVGKVESQTQSDQLYKAVNSANFKVDDDNIITSLSTLGIQSASNKKGDIGIKIGKQTLVIPKGASEAQRRAIISKAVGAKQINPNEDFGLEYDDDGNLISPGYIRTPIKRVSPFKRLTSWFEKLGGGSPLNKDKEYGEKKETVGEWETLEDGRQRRVITTDQDWKTQGEQKSFSDAGVDPEAAKAYWAANPEEYAKYKAGKTGVDSSQREEFRPAPEAPQPEVGLPPTPPAPAPEEPADPINFSITRPSKSGGTRAAHGASYQDFNDMTPEQLASAEKRAVKANDYNAKRNLKTPEMLAKDRGWDLDNLNPAQKKWIDKTIAAKNKIYENNKVTLTKK